jgi:hypothetical protein
MHCELRQASWLLDHSSYSCGTALDSLNQLIQATSFHLYTLASGLSGYLNS